MSWDPVWEKVFQEQEWGKYPAESLIRFIARNYYRKDRKNIRLLELGCGPGANIWYMAREGFDVCGIDGSETAIDKGKKRLDSEGLKASLITGDITSLPFDDNFFDGIIDVECLYSNNRESTGKILTETKRVLKKDALFYSRTFTNEMFVGKSFEEIGHLEYSNISDGPLAGKGFVRLADEEEMRELYGKLFKILSLDRLEYTYNNSSIKVSEWIIICQK